MSVELRNHGVAAASSVSVALAGSIPGVPTRRRRLRGFQTAGAQPRAAANANGGAATVAWLNPFKKDHVHLSGTLCGSQQASVFVVIASGKLVQVLEVGESSIVARCSYCMLLTGCA